MTTETTEQKKPYYLGHRARVKEKFMKNPEADFSDYERLEMILALAIPRKDVKPLAKELLNEFTSLSNVLYASPAQLQKFSGIKEHTCYVFKLFATVAQRLTQIDAAQAPVMDKWEKLLDYCYVRFAHKKNEHFHVLFLNGRHQIIADEEIQKGTVNHTPLYPREVLKRALVLEATSVILVHNHPSGDPKPSKEDVERTKDLREILGASDISIHDHLVVGKTGIFSFRQYGLL